MAPPDNDAAGTAASEWTSAVARRAAAGVVAEGLGVADGLAEAAGAADSAAACGLASSPRMPPRPPRMLSTGFGWLGDAVGAGAGADG
ncbi:hypothetical protein GXW82_38855 [Streptacidiphilus sp. 4-A2]|nr:hypothetical protein [Streptacidiphilus sp. 4-A2]